MHTRDRQGFTLVEMLVVVAIIALLMSLLLPVITDATEHARRVMCQSNLRQAALVIEGYANDNREWYPGVRCWCLHDWYVGIHHFLPTNHPLYGSTPPDRSNPEMVQYGMTLSLLRCPSRPDPEHRGTYGGGWLDPTFRGYTMTDYWGYFGRGDIASETASGAPGETYFDPDIGYEATGWVALSHPQYLTWRGLYEPQRGPNNETPRVVGYGPALGRFSKRIQKSPLLFDRAFAPETETAGAWPQAYYDNVGPDGVPANGQMSNHLSKSHINSFGGKFVAEGLNILAFDLSITWSNYGKIWTNYGLEREVQYYYWEYVGKDYYQLMWDSTYRN